MMYNIESNGKTFQVEFNKNELLQHANNLFTKFTTENYVAYRTSPEWGDPYIDENTYKQNVQKFIDEINAINEEKLASIVNTMPKKKNGKFAKNRIHPICSCDNTNVIHEWHNTWIYEQVIAKAENEDKLIISMHTFTDTPA